VRRGNRTIAVAAALIAGCGSRTSVLFERATDGGVAVVDAPVDRGVDAVAEADAPVETGTPPPVDAGEDAGPYAPFCGIPAFDAPPAPGACLPGRGATALSRLPAGFDAVGALDVGQFYLYGESGFGTLPKGGGAVRSILPPPSGRDLWSSIAFDTDAVYLGTLSRGLVRVPKAGGCSILLSRQSATSVALDDSYVYFVASTAKGDSIDIERVPKIGGPAETVARPFTKLGMGGMVVVGTWLLWAEGYAIHAVTTSGGSEQVVYDMNRQIIGWTADARGVCVLARNDRLLDDDLFAVAFPPLGATTKLLEGVAGSIDGVSDGTFLYWFGSVGGVAGVTKTNEITGATSTLAVDAADTAGLGDFQVDDSCVYWASRTQSGVSSLMTVAK
jgi:hypothetical protein